MATLGLSEIRALAERRHKERSKEMADTTRTPPTGTSPQGGSQAATTRPVDPITRIRALLDHGNLPDGDQPAAQWLKLATAEAKADPAWTEMREPWCRRCAACNREHRRVTELVWCRRRTYHQPWSLPDGSWTTATRLWLLIRAECPEMLWGTSPAGLGKRLVREGWVPRWRHDGRFYHLDDLADPHAVPPEPTRARRRSR